MERLSPTPKLLGQMIGIMLILWPKERSGGNRVMVAAVRTKAW